MTFTKLWFYLRPTCYRSLRSKVVSLFMNLKSYRKMALILISETLSRIFCEQGENVSQHKDWNAPLNKGFCMNILRLPIFYLFINLLAYLLIVEIIPIETFYDQVFFIFFGSITFKCLGQYAPYSSCSRSQNTTLQSLQFRRPR